MNNNQAFPYRNLILFITFVVILVTLVFQGLTLPWIIRKIHPRPVQVTISEYEQELTIQKKIAHSSLQYLEQKIAEDGPKNAHLKNLHERVKLDVQFFTSQLDGSGNEGENTLKNFQLAYLEILDYQRNALTALNHKAEYDEELIRKYLSLIDMEEYKIREKLTGEAAQ